MIGFVQGAKWLRKVNPRSILSLVILSLRKETHHHERN